jgi:ribose transport system substrate-binding protein
MTASRNPIIAVFTKNSTNPAYAAARLGADRAAQRLGARTVHYVPRQPDNVEEQLALIEQALARRPDAMVLVPVHPTAINASIRRINAAGIPVVGYINRFTAGDCVTYVGSEDYPLAVSIASYLCGQLAGHGEIVLVEGPRDSITSVERVRGFHAALKHYPGIRVVASICGDYQREPARRAMAQLLNATPRVDGILAANDIMAVGAIDALEAAGRKSLIVGVNAIPEAIAEIKRGRMLATVDFDAMKMGCLATEAAIRHLRGEALPPEIILPVQIVDRANCAGWDRPFERRECLRWEDVVK